MIDLGISWWAAIALGLAALAVAVALTAYRWKRRHWLSAQAKVTTVGRSQTKPSGGEAAGETIYRVRYRFMDDVTEDVRTGVTITMYHTIRKNEQVRVRYDPHDPDQSELVTPVRLLVWWGGVVLLTAAGLVLLMSGYADVLTLP